MKIVSIFIVVAVLSSVNCLRRVEQHQFPFLDSMNPLQTASFMSGDYTQILPESLRPMARKILGIQQSGAQSMLSKASSLFGGSKDSGDGGMFGGMSSFFGNDEKKGEGNGVFSSIKNAFGGSDSSSSGGLFNSFTSALGGGGSKKESSGGFSGLRDMLPFHDHE